jgi:hypothetical protein
MTDVTKILRLALVAATAVLLAGVLACGDDDGDEATPTPEPSATEEATGTPGPDGETATPTVAPAESTAGMSLVEWAIRPDKTRARPGTVTFLVRNEGTVTHQFLVIRSDIEKDELPRNGDKGVDLSDLDVVGSIDAIAPGENDEVTVDVEEGPYILLCNLFSGGESHYLTGMYNEFEVTPTAPLDALTPAPTQ